MAGIRLAQGRRGLQRQRGLEGEGDEASGEVVGGGGGRKGEEPQEGDDGPEVPVDVVADAVEDCRLAETAIAGQGNHAVGYVVDDALKGEVEFF